MKLFILVLAFLHLVGAQEYDDPSVPRADICQMNRPVDDFVLFNNTFKVPLGLYWYEDEINRCKKHPTAPTLYYGHIKPGGVKSIGTTVGHVFRFLDEWSRVWKCFVIKPKV